MKEKRKRDHDDEMDNLRENITAINESSQQEEDEFEQSINSQLEQCDAGLILLLF